MATLLQLTQDFCRRTGIPVPSSVIGSVDDQVRQIQGIGQKTLEDMVKRFDWEQLTKEALFTTIASENQGAITTIAPDGFDRILNETIFDRTLRLPVYGPLNASQWQALKALPTTGPLYQYRLRGGQLLFQPSPVAPGHLCAFEYISTWIVYDPVNDIYKSQWTLDTDTIVLDDTIYTAGLTWNWKAEKGIDYAEDFRRYEDLCTISKAGDGTKPRVNLANPYPNIYPGIWVPSGSWNT